MKELFSNILVPVNINRTKASLYIEKAFLIAKQLNSHLHILHIEKSRQLSSREYFSGTSEEEKATKTYQKLQALQSFYTHQTEGNISIYTTAFQGNTEQIILEYCTRQHIDLIISQKPSFFRFFADQLNIRRLSHKSGSPLLLIDDKPGAETLRNIVIPVNADLPVRKLMFTSHLARKFHSKIHLIALAEPSDKGGADDIDYLYRAYQLLRTHSSVVVECHPVSGDNIADSTLDFARRIHADLIVVDSGKESLLTGFLHRLSSRFIFHQSRIPVMTINSA